MYCIGNGSALTSVLFYEKHNVISYTSMLHSSPYGPTVMKYSDKMLPCQSFYNLECSTSSNCFNKNVTEGPSVSRVFERFLTTLEKHIKNVPM